MAVTQTKTESAAEVVGLVLDQIDRLAREPIDEATAAERGAFLANSLSNQIERATGLADYLATLVATRAPLATLKTEVSASSLPDAATVAAAVADHLGRDRATVIVAGDSSQWVSALRGRFPNVERVDADGKPVS